MKRTLLKKAAILLLAAALVALSSCAPAKKAYEVRDYVLELPYKEGFRILQLADIHLAAKDNRQEKLQFIRKTIEDAHADYIVVTGDIFTFADKATARDLFTFLDSFGIPWSVTFGNHDEQCMFSVDWLTDYLNNFGGNCVFKDLQDDDVYGNANFAVNLMDGSEVKAQVIIMDSNRYNFGPYSGYDFIKEDQVEWYRKLVNETTENNAGTPVPSVAFFHIPLMEFDEAYEKAMEGDPEAVLVYGDKREKVCCPELNTGLFEAMKELGSTKAVCCSHDHINNFIVNYQGIDLVYSLKADDRIYYDEDRLGGKVIILQEDGTIAYDHIYETLEAAK